MKWICLLLTLVIEVAAIWLIGPLHNGHLMVALLSLLLFVGIVIQQSREDMPLREERMISGYLWGTYLAAAVVCLLVWKRYILVS